MKRPVRLFLVAGEVSGDLLGGRLMAALRQLTGDRVVFDGIGGSQMSAQGLVSRFPMAELSLMGIAETLPHLPALLRRLRETHAAVRTARPDALITIDAPAFSLRLARRVGPGVTRRIHYVAPQVWAWRPGRAVEIARSLDRLLTLLPFEPPYFTPLGLACDYVGHPVIESGALHGNGQRFRHWLGIGSDTPLLVLLPGSRHGEIKRLLAIFRQTVQGLQDRLPDLVTVAPLAAGVAGAVREGLAGLGQVRFVEQEGLKYDAFAAAHAALAASGTVTLELALAGTPSVVGYRVAPVTAWLARRLLQVPCVALSNIVLGAPVYPELLQELCTPENLTTALLPLLNRLNPAWQKQRTALRAVLDIMGTGQGSPSDRAARIVLADLAAVGGLNLPDACNRGRQLAE